MIGVVNCSTQMSRMSVNLMLKWNVVVCLFFVSIGLTYAQAPWILGKLEGYDNSNFGDWMYLRKSGPLRSLEVIDSVKIDANGKFQFTNDRAIFPALYRLQLKGGEPNLFFCENQGKIEVFSTATDIFYGNAVVRGSVENEVYQKFEKFKNEPY